MWTHIFAKKKKNTGKERKGQISTLPLSYWFQATLKIIGSLVSSSYAHTKEKRLCLVHKCKRMQGVENDLERRSACLGVRHDPAVPAGITPSRARASAALCRGRTVTTVPAGVTTRDPEPRREKPLSPRHWGSGFVFPSVPGIFGDLPLPRPSRWKPGCACDSCGERGMRGTLRVAGCDPARSLGHCERPGSSAPQ